MAKLLISDYDGTYKIKGCNDVDIKANNSAIEKFINCGNKFVISSGRVYIDVLAEIKKYQILVSYFSCANGNAIFDNFSNLISYNKITYKDILVFKEFFQIFDYIKSYNPYGEEDNKNIVEFEIRYKNNEAKEKFKKYLLDNCIYNFYHSVDDPLIIHIFNFKHSKSDSIEMISDIEHIDKNDIYCIGDGYNDLDMIRKYNGYSIRGTKPDIKKEALGEYNSVADLANDILEEKVQTK